MKAKTHLKAGLSPQPLPPRDTPPDPCIRQA
jgi:hypothetical protein